MRTTRRKKTNNPCCKGPFVERPLVVFTILIGDIMKTTIHSTTAERRILYHANIARGLVLAALIHISILGSYRIYTQFFAEHSHEAVTTFIKHITVMPPPPSIHNTTVLPALSINPISAPSIGTPVPVPESMITPEATIATQQELNQAYQGNEFGENGGTIIISENTVIDEGPPPVFVPVEKQPEVVHAVFPTYPEIPRRAGVEGIVYVKMWVTMEGKVRQAEVVKSSSELFNQISVDAALQWTFTPAIMNNGPIAVWITVPFKFYLRSQ